MPNLSLKAIGPATPTRYETTTRQRLMNAMPANQTIGYLTSQRPAFQAVPNTPSAFAQPSTIFCPFMMSFKRSCGYFEF